jgi:hypothetical protein
VRVPMAAAVDVVVTGYEVIMIAVTHEAAGVIVEMRSIVPVGVPWQTPSPAYRADVGRAAVADMRVSEINVEAAAVYVNALRTRLIGNTPDKNQCGK